MPTSVRSKSTQRRRAASAAEKAETREATYQRVTDLIVAQLEAGASGGNWSTPWRAITTLPINVSTKRPYRGINIFALGAAAAERGYTIPLWGTYKQWADKGGQVQKRPSDVPEGRAHSSPSGSRPSGRTRSRSTPTASR